jgi:hypothetical protein
MYIKVIFFNSSHQFMLSIMFVARVCIHVTLLALIAFSCLVTIISELFAQRKLTHTHTHTHTQTNTHLNAVNSLPILSTLGQLTSDLQRENISCVNVAHRNKQLKREANGRPFPFHSLYVITAVLLS